MRARNTIVAVIMLLPGLLLQGCGRKGPLYLEQKPVAPAPSVQSQPATKQPELMIQPAQSAVAPTATVPNTTEPTKQP